ncbi:MAG: hypothetical protein AB7F78_25645 [Hyphomicrobiaceae bacterium]
MTEGIEEPDIPPPEINRFEWLWLSAMMISVVVAILMYDYSVDGEGAFLAALINIFLFGVAALLMSWRAAGTAMSGDCCCFRFCWSSRSMTSRTWQTCWRSLSRRIWRRSAWD